MKRILILEDNEIMHLLYQTVLEKKYHVTIVTTVEDAITMNETNKYDLYIVDLMINNSDGKTGVNFIETGIQPYLIISALELDKSKFETNINYIRKPFSNIQLLNKIGELI